MARSYPTGHTQPHSHTYTYTYPYTCLIHAQTYSPYFHTNPTYVHKIQSLAGDYPPSELSLSSSHASDVNKQLNTLMQASELHVFGDFEDHMSSNGAVDFRNAFVHA
ncbi:hypothetical protein EON63_17485 [archaeon]|nr:MAG: hypothetical protein EON63_17485 [archaeon]